MQVEILPNGPRYRNHYMETNLPSLLIGVCIHTCEMENHLTQTKWNVCKCVASHVCFTRALPQHENKGSCFHEVKFMPHMFIRVVALIDIEILKYFPHELP